MRVIIIRETKVSLNSLFSMNKGRIIVTKRSMFLQIIWIKKLEKPMQISLSNRNRRATNPRKAVPIAIYTTIYGSKPKLNNR